MLRREDGAAYAKCAPASRSDHLRGERERLTWLAEFEVAAPRALDWREGEEGSCLVMSTVSGVPASELSGADLFEAWRSIVERVAALHRLPADLCPFDRGLEAMYARAVGVVARDAVNPDFLPDEDRATPAEDLLARVRRELPVRLAQETGDRVVCHGDACLPNLMVDPTTLTCTGLIDLGRLGAADRYADIALMVANSRESWTSPDQEARAFAILCDAIGVGTGDRERLDFYLRLDPLTWG